MTRNPDQACREILGFMREGSSYEIAVQQARVPPLLAQHWYLHGTGTGFDFAGEVRAIEADLIIKAEERVKDIMAGEQPAMTTTRAERRSMNTQLAAAMWFLEKRYPKVYGWRPPLHDQLRREVVDALLSMLEEHAPPDVLDAVVDVLAYPSTPALGNGEPDE